MSHVLPERERRELITDERYHKHHGKNCGNMCTNQNMKPTEVLSPQSRFTMDTLPVIENLPPIDLPSTVAVSLLR